MADLWLRRAGGALYPDGDDSAAVFEKIPRDKPLHCEIKVPRSTQMHRLFWALCQRIAQGMGRDDITADTVCTEFKLATGHCDIYRSKRYGEVRVPRSIAFHKMDNIEFRDFFNRCCNVAYETWHIDPAAVADLLAPDRGDAC